MSLAEDEVVLVDVVDRPVGALGKMAAHRDGLLHRAVSVMLFDARGRVLLQQRAATKYHCAGLWTNSCCGHPRVGEAVLDAAHRRLEAELGIRGAPLARMGSFRYQATLPNGLVEHELDHVLAGRWIGAVVPNPDEVAAVRWVTREDLEAEMREQPTRFTPWLGDVLRLI